MNLRLIILFILFNIINQVSSKFDLTFNEINLLKLSSLSFYREHYTISNMENVPQMHCKSYYNECKYQPNIIRCTNDDYRNFTSIKKKELNWSCYSEGELPDSYYIEKASVRVKCIELYRSKEGIFVLQGSCYIMFEFKKTPQYKSYIIVVVVFFALALSRI